MSEYFVGMANSMFASGINFLAMPMMFANPRLVLEKTIDEVVVPALADMFGKLNGPVVFHHGGNPLAASLRHYRALPNIGGFVIDSRDDFVVARKSAGEKMLLLGNLDGPSLGKISPALALEKARKILENRKEDKHFIFATAAADVAWDTPLDTITGIRDLMQHYGSGHDG
jgi:uroporphyrinogen decarboxylase